MEQTENLGGAHVPGAPLVPTPMLEATKAEASSYVATWRSALLR